MDLFIGDVHLQRIPQYFVHEMKLQLRILGEDISILGKWNSDSQIIRFQETIHISSSSSLTAARINLSFVLVALLQGQKSESRVIGSGIGFASIETLAVPQTVMLRSSNMADLMARLLFIVTFDHSEPQKSDMYYRTDSWIDLNQGSSNEFTSKVVKEGEGYDSQTRKDDLTCQKRNFRMEGGSKIRNRAAPEKVVMINTQYRQQPYRANQRESERPVAVNNCHNTSLFDSRSNQLESLQQFTERAKRKAEEKLRVIRPVSTTGIVQIVHICPNAMKENEACERLRGALDKKGEMLRRAQSQLDTNVKVSSDAKVKEICRGSAQYQHDRSLDRSDYFTTGDDRNYFKESRGESRLKQAETRRLQLLMETAHKAACRSLDATNRSISIKAAAIISNRACNKIQNAPDQRDGILKIGETHLDASVRSSISNVRSGSRNGTKADALQAARHSLELKEIRREERRALDIKSRLQSAENRRLKVLRKQKDKAAAMASEATCKAEAIKQAALNASRAYNRLRNDFDRKDEMLRRVQSELDTSTRSIRDKSYISNRLDRSSSSRYNSSTDNSPVKQRSEGGLDQSRHMRASSAPARYRGNYGPHSIPFSELKMASRPNHRERSAAPTVLTVKTVAYRQKSDSISGIRSSHVHRIPLVASGKRNVAIGSSGNDARYTLCPSHHSPRRSHSASPQRYHQSTSKPSGFSTASAANDVSIGEVDSNLNQYIRSRQRSVTDNPENIFYPCGTSSRPAGLPVTDMHMSSYTQGKLLRLVQQRIQGLKQKISEVSSSEGEVILRMIRKMLPLTSALSRPRRNGHSSLTSGPRVRKRASMSERPEMLESTAHLHSTSRERSGDTPDLLTNEIGDSTSSRTVDHEGGKETDNSEDGDDRNSEDAENINADILVAQLWDILGVTAEYGSHSKTLRDRETLQESDDSNLRRIDKAAESAKRTYDAGKELLTSKYQEIYNQHYRGYSRGGSEQADDSLHSDHYVNERSLRPPYSDITAAYSQSVADLSSNSFLRARLHLDSEGDLPQNNSSALEDDSREVIEMSSPSTEESLNVSEADSIRNGMIRNSSDVLVSETSTSSIHPSLTHSRGWAIGCSRPPLSLSVQEISTQLPKNTDQQSYENRPNEDTQSAPDDYCDDIDEEENFRGSPINVNDTSACINRQIEDVGKAINTLQVSKSIQKKLFR